MTGVPLFAPRADRMAEFDREEDEAPPAPITLRTLREAAGLFRYLWPYRVKFVLGMLALVVGNLFGLAFPWLAGVLVNVATGQGGKEVTDFWGENIDLVALALMGALAVQASFAFLRAMWFIEVGERSLADLRRDTYARLIRLPMSFHS